MVIAKSVCLEKIRVDEDLYKIGKKYMKKFKKEYAKKNPGIPPNNLDLLLLSAFSYAMSGDSRRDFEDSGRSYESYCSIMNAALARVRSTG